MTDIPEDVMKLAQAIMREYERDWDNGLNVIARALIADRAAQAERMARMEKLLEGRDKFIVDEGLWPAFVLSLPRRALSQEGSKPS